LLPFRHYESFELGDTSANVNQTTRRKEHTSLSSRPEASRAASSSLMAPSLISARVRNLIRPSRVPWLPLPIRATFSPFFSSRSRCTCTSTRFIPRHQPRRSFLLTMCLVNLLFTFGDLGFLGCDLCAVVHPFIRALGARVRRWPFRIA